ncbi:type II secretion system GspH family protein [bacterium]|nr:type II secretion system GspH family protein [bacterium]
MSRYLRNSKGFTLIELVIGTGILAFVLCGIVGGLVSFISLAQMARDRTVAVNDAKQVMEQIWDTPFSSIITTIGSTDWTDWLVNNGGNGLDSELISVTYNDSVSDLLQITVTVTWQTRNRPLSVSIVSLKTEG